MSERQPDRARDLHDTCSPAIYRQRKSDQRRHKMADRIDSDLPGDGIDRRGFLKCMAWAGTGLLCTLNGGILTSLGLGEAAEAKGKAATGELSFAQISDSHIGFNKAANKD